jgi:serine/threonine protein phosphatase PrpC
VAMLGRRGRRFWRAAPVTLRAAGRSEQGPVRSQNQDACLVDTGGRLFAVADGIGGHRAGDVAAGLAVEHLGAALGRARRRGRSERDALAAALVELHELVLARASADPDLAGMGTTIVVASSPSGRTVHLAHVGDSRAYLLAAGAGLRLLTSDHSAANLLAGWGAISAEEAASHPFAHHLTRAIGLAGSEGASTATITMAAGDRLLLCSDGLTGTLDDERIEALLAAAAGPEAACDALVDAAIAAGASDNVTALVVQA